MIRFHFVQGQQANIIVTASNALADTQTTMAVHEQLTCQLPGGCPQRGEVDDRRDAGNSRTGALETVSDAADSFDEVAMIAQFFAQSHDLAIDGTIRDRVIRPLNGFDDLLACMHITGMAGKKMQHSELGSRQRKRPAFNEGFLRPRLNNDPMDFDGVGFVEHCECRLLEVGNLAVTVDALSITFRGATVKYPHRLLGLVSRRSQNDAQIGQKSFRQSIVGHTVRRDPSTGTQIAFRNSSN